jgi:hypothetical protein
MLCVFGAEVYWNGIFWLAHIGFDRSLGYGLKYSSGFKHTHLGILAGRKNSIAVP